MISLLIALIIQFNDQRIEEQMVHVPTDEIEAVYVPAGYTGPLDEIRTVEETN